MDQGKEMTPVERVARAIALHLEYSIFGKGDDHRWRDFVPVSRVAIEALKPASEKQKDAGRHATSPWTGMSLETAELHLAEPIYEAMLNAALEEGT